MIYRLRKINMNKLSNTWLDLLLAKDHKKRNPIEKISFFEKALLGLFL